MSINKICYTFNSENGTSLTQGFLSPQDFINFYKITLKETYKFYNNIVVYCDYDGKEYLKENGINYDFETIDFKNSYKNKYPNFNKYLTIKEQKEPFLHIDNDVILRGKFPNKSMNSDIICEKLRIFHFDNIDEFNFISPYTSSDVYKYNSLICTGLIGGTNIEVFRERFEICENAMLNNINDEITFYKIIAFEEIVLTYLAKTKNLKVVELPINKFVHFQGSNKELLRNIQSISDIPFRYFEYS